MKNTLVLLALCLTCYSSFAQTDRQQIETTIQLYFDGWATGDTAKLSKAMHYSCHLKNYRDGRFILFTKSDYVSRFRPKERDKNLSTNIVYVDITDNLIAGAKVEIHTATDKFTDYFNLMKTTEGWFIVDKISTRTPHRIRTAMPEKEPVLKGLSRPWSMAFLSEDEVIISEKEGDLLRVNLRTKVRTPIKGYPTDVVGKMGGFGDNAGKFEVVLDPQFSQNKYIYLSYSAENEAGKTTKVIRAILENDALTNLKTLLLATPYANECCHYGGGMIFGPDGKLYISIGERLFTEKDEPALPFAQNVQDKRGKIYRINSDGSIPSDNPNFGAGATPGLYAMGIRATQGLAHDPISHKIWFSEHGTQQGDEINVLKAGANYGWPIKTSGKYRFEGYTPPKLKDSTYTAPVWFWQQTVAPTGLTFYTGDEFPTWKGNLFVTGLSKGSLWRVTLENETVKNVEELFLDSRVRARKVLQSPMGKLYILTDEMNGQLIRIVNRN
ncbi:PQQ-dependent sugar dehydrogenase [Haliscomenobacter sp.]|uniref:PQQ-dependent sugar dehydrogenase n=1 Tax=Haliscomenobacter sp. TaxID=2717303 RepID=UPI0035943965